MKTLDGAGLAGREGDASVIAIDLAGTEGRAAKRIRIER
jgi:hypothetical protein